MYIQSLALQSYATCPLIDKLQTHCFRVHSQCASNSISQLSWPKNIYPTPSLLLYIVPWEIQSPASLQPLTFQVFWHPLSQEIHPLETFLRIGNSNNQGIYLTQTIMLVTTFSWKSMDTIGYECPTMTLLVKCFTNILLHVPISFSIVSNACYQFQRPNWVFIFFMYQAHNFY